MSVKRNIKNNNGSTININNTNSGATIISTTFQSSTIKAFTQADAFTVCCQRINDMVTVTVYFNFPSPGITVANTDVLELTTGLAASYRPTRPQVSNYIYNPDGYLVPSVTGKMVIGTNGIILISGYNDQLSSGDDFNANGNSITYNFYN